MASTINPLAIDPTKPETGKATTESVRANTQATQDQFIAAKTDIEALQAGANVLTAGLSAANANIATNTGAITTLDGRVDAIEATPPGTTTKYYATKAAMDADLVPADGTGGIVTNDPDASNNSPTIFRKSGATGTGSWVKSQDRLRPTEDAIVGSVAFNDIIRYDRSNVYGGGTFQLYVPRGLWIKRGTQTVANLTINPDSTELPGFVKVGLTNAQRNYVYLDRNDNTIKVVVSSAGDMTMPATDTTKVIPIATFNFSSANVKVTWASPHRIVEVDPMEKGLVTVGSPFIYSRSDNKILVPSFTFRMSGAVQTYTPTNGQKYDEFPGPSSSQTAAILMWWDSRLQQIKTTTAGVEPYNIEIGGALLGRAYVSNFWSPYPYVGLGSAGRGQNSFAFGKKPSLAPKVQVPGNAHIVAVTDPALTALGFTEGMANNHPTTGSLPAYGDYLPDTRWPQWYFGRIYIQTTVPDDFGTPRVWFNKDTPGATNSWPLTLEKKFSSTAAMYSGFFKAPDPSLAPIDTTNPWSYFYIGTGTPNAPDRYIVTGGQLAPGPNAWWVERDDYPTQQNVENRVRVLEGAVASSDPAIDLLYGPDLWMISGEEQSLYPDNINASRSDEKHFETAFVSLKDTVVDVDDTASTFNLTAVDAYIRETVGAPIVIDPDKLGDETYIMVRRYADTAALPNQRYSRRAITKHVAPATVSATLGLHMTGDSLTAPATMKQQLKARLKRMGITANFIGSMQFTSDKRVGNEGKGGWSFASAINAITLPAQPGQPAGLTKPIDVGGEAAYLALDDDGSGGNPDNKIIYNPYIRLATGGDDPAKVFNGYIFDFNFYRNRWSGTTLGVLPVPDYVILNFGTGDLNNFTPPTDAQWVTTGLEIVVGSMLADGVPHVGALFPTFPHSSRDAKWPQYVGVIKAIMTFREGLSPTDKAKVDLLPAWAHIGQNAGWVMSAVTDPDTGASVETITDQTHYYDDLTRTQINKVHAAWLACKAAGV